MSQSLFTDRHRMGAPAFPTEPKPNSHPSVPPSHPVLCTQSDARGNPCIIRPAKKISSKYVLSGAQLPQRMPQSSSGKPDDAVMCC